MSIPQPDLGSDHTFVTPQFELVPWFCMPVYPFRRSIVDKWISCPALTFWNEVLWIAAFQTPGLDCSLVSNPFIINLPNCTSDTTVSLGSLQSS